MGTTTCNKTAGDNDWRYPLGATFYSVPQVKSLHHSLNNRDIICLFQMQTSDSLSIVLAT